ncbi:Inner membrane protein YghQ [Rhodobacteraceae bacterium THAF1]|uniref:lipopolysaccharide biosynthesis protein n=1 Tax=Palleronia sp. THAF1 TaxID=2587842 RepID=UPI000F3D936C|nr:lipopolysaccharide biosynthesis protein [Palleronia sp. THAF1]QFU10342.1 Inner membrane protein YghQ [Palleronia sp. THAF1]VDC31460.1 Inner membrane protein YghQ [Rhodobacteraceae bacterium THAF1]
MTQTFDGLWAGLWAILSSNVIVAVLTFATLALTSRALAPAGLGLLVLIEAYGRLFDQILRLEPTQALIRLATDQKNNPDGAPFRRLIKFGILLDVAGSVLAATAAILLLPFVGGWFGFDDTGSGLVLLFCLTLLVPAPMTARALLRLFDRFSLYARINVATALLRLAGTVLLYWLGAEIQHFVILLCAVSLFERLAPSVVCWPILQRASGRGVMATPLRGLLGENTGLWRFIWAANLSVLARGSTRQFDVPILSGFVGLTEIGLYVLAKRFAMLLIRVGSPVQLVVYPRMCELVSRGDSARIAQFVTAMMVCFASLSVVGLAVFYLIGTPLVATVFGAEFTAAVPLILVQLVGACLLLMGTILNSALQAVRREGQLLTISVIAALLFFLPIPILVPAYGIIAACYLFAGVGAIVVLGCALSFRSALRASPQRPARE